MTAARAAAGRGAPPRPRVLVVDPDPGAAVVMPKVLAPLGVAVVVVATVAAARAAARAGWFDVAVAVAGAERGRGLALLAGLRDHYGCRTLGLHRPDAAPDDPGSADAWLPTTVGIDALRAAVGGLLAPGRAGADGRPDAGRAAGPNLGA
jgi:CheY-like chemotaxis protein